MTLENVRDSWGGWYDAGLAAGEFWALRLVGAPLLGATTPEGLESAIRADWSRWQRQAPGRAR
jgi:hypothetical protein